MNRKSKIIVSVVGIAIVLLALLGITYAYYLTRIEGNTNTNSISVTTADLRLVYGDGNGIITKNDIMPGTTIGEKTFTVKNTGKTKINDYAVTLEYAFLEDVIPSIFERPNDFEITLTCSSTKGDGTTGTCNGFTGKFNNENIIMTSNSIESEEIHNYSLTIYYANPNEDQSNDMGKNLNLIVNIVRLSETADINGEITGVDNTYSLRLNSETKVSSIIKNSDNKYVYNFKGVPLGVHTLSVIDKDGDIVSSHKLVIESGEEAKTGTKEITYVEEGENVTKTVPSITIKNEKRVASVTTSVNTTSSTVSTTGSSIGDCEYYPKAGELLMDAIINNAKANKNGTIYSPTPLTTPAEDTSGEDERTLSITQDNMGDGASYYFRGSVQDNYVLFNNMCFRIVRIEGDGSVKLIYAGDVTEGATNCNEVGETTGFLKGEIYDPASDETMYDFIYAAYGYDSDGLAAYENYEGGLEDAIETWYKTKFTTEILKGKLKTDKWCLGASENFKYDNYGNLLDDADIENQYRYSSGNRVWNLKTTSLMCENEDFVESKYGLLTVDEVMLAGGTDYEKNESYYLNENAKTYSWWTLSYSYSCDSFGGGFTINWGGRLSDECISDSYITSENSLVRPAITLIPRTTIVPGGDGTKTNPYVIN